MGHVKGNEFMFLCNDYEKYVYSFSEKERLTCSDWKMDAARTKWIQDENIKTNRGLTYFNQM